MRGRMNIDGYINTIERIMDNRQSVRQQKHFFPGYKVVCKKKNYTLLKPSLLNRQIVAAWNNAICAVSKYHKKAIYIYPNYKNKHRYYHVELKKKNFPGLLPHSKIANCLIIPFIREVSATEFYPSWRVVIFTDKCQVYHNFPSRDSIYEGTSKRRDVIRFVESEIWDLPDNKYPSCEKKHDDVEYYNPFLPKECYEYHPPIEEGNVNKYGGATHKKSKTISIDGKDVRLSRFYFPIRRIESNSFSFMGGFSPDYKMTLIGTYQSNTSFGVRTVVFATSDGGRNFYAKYEFDDSGLRAGNLGNPLNGCVFSNYMCENEQISIQERTIIIGSDSKPAYYYGEKVSISKIHSSCPIVVETKDDSSIRNGGIVRLSGNTSNPELNCLFSGALYKVKKIGNKQFALYEMASRSTTGIACRHIHGINRVKDGWLICTGETFPEGWLLYVQMKASDTWEIADASIPLDFIRLNNSRNSVQRIIGSTLYDDEDSSIIVASDSAIIERKPFYGELSHSSTGIYKGTLSSVDDFSSFKLIHELREVCYFFKEINGVLIACGQRGELAISFDKGESWESNRIEMALQHYGGSTPEFIVIDGWLLVFN